MPENSPEHYTALRERERAAARARARAIAQRAAALPTPRDPIRAEARTWRTLPSHDSAEDTDDDVPGDRAPPDLEDGTASRSPTPEPIGTPAREPDPAVEELADGIMGMRIDGEAERSGSSPKPGNAEAATQGSDEAGNEADDEADDKSESATDDKSDDNREASARCAVPLEPSPPPRGSLAMHAAAGLTAPPSPPQTDAAPDAFTTPPTASPESDLQMYTPPGPEPVTPSPSTVIITPPTAPPPSSPPGAPSTIRTLRTTIPSPDSNNSVDSPTPSPSSRPVRPAPRRQQPATPCPAPRLFPNNDPGHDGDDPFAFPNGAAKRKR